MPDLTAEEIAARALKPAKAAGDGQSAEQVPIPDQIEAAKFKAANETTDGVKRSGIRMIRCIPPGAAGC